VIQTRLWITNNIFDRGQADWGGYLYFDLLFSIVSENNTFQNGLAQQLLGTNKIGTGSTLVITGVINRTVSEYIGYRNKYLKGLSESQGLFKNLINL